MTGDKREAAGLNCLGWGRLEKVDRRFRRRHAAQAIPPQASADAWMLVPLSADRGYR
jgi:hypothetical protein